MSTINPHLRTTFPLTDAEVVVLKKEQPSFRPAVPTPQQIDNGTLDYSTSITLIEQALRELKEAIPGGQSQRVVTFMEQLAHGKDHLLQYLFSCCPETSPQVQTLQEALEEPLNY